MRRPILAAPAALALLAALAAAPARADDEERALPLGADAEAVILENGLEVVVIEKRTVPLVTINVAVRTGAFTETPLTDGLAHLYEHMFFKGNAAIPSQEEYMRRVYELGIQFNGTTSTEKVDYFITLPSRNFTAGMKFMSDALLTPLFNQQELENERPVVIGEYDRNEANPAYHLGVAMGKALYPGTYHRKNPLGSREIILSATREQMIDFRERYYVPNNSCLIIVGDVNRTAALALAKDLFGAGAWPEGDDPHDEERQPHAPLTESKYLIVQKPTKAATARVTWRGPDIGRDDRATVVADVFGTLVALPTSRFQKALRDSGLASGASLGYYSQRENGELHFNAVVNGEKVNEVIDACFTEIQKMVSEPGYFGEEEVRVAARNLETSWLYAGEQGQQLARDMGFWWAVADLDYYRDYLPEARTVTADELRAFAQRYLLGQPHVLGVLCSEEMKAKLDLSEESLAARVRAANASAGPEAAVQRLTLDNGLPVLVRRDPGSPSSALCVLFDGGARNLGEGDEGVERLLLQAIIAGSEELPREQLRARIAALGASLSAGSDYDLSVLTAKAPRASFEETVRILAGCVRAPELEAEEVERIREAIMNDLRNEQENPDRRLWRCVNDTFFTGHPYQRYPAGRLETVPGLEVTRLRAHREKILRADRMLLVVVGDHDPMKVRALLQAAFGSLPKGDGAALPALPKLSGDGPLFEADEREIPTTYLAGKFPIPNPGDPGYAAAFVAFQFLSQKMWDSIRTRHSLSYAPFAGSSIYRSNYGYVYVTTTEPERCAELIWEDARGLATELVTQDQIDSIAARRYTSIYQGAEKPDVHASGLGRAELAHGGFARFYGQVEDLRRVTPEEVRDAARLLFRGLRFGYVGPRAVEEEALKKLAAGVQGG